MPPASLTQLREQVAAAAEHVQRSPTIPPEVTALVRDFGDQLDAAASADPPRAADLWQAAYQAAVAQERTELRFALETLLDVLDEIIEAAPYGPMVPIKDVLDRVAALLTASPDALAELVGGSASTLRRWRSGQSEPAGAGAERVRTVGLMIEQLHHVFTPNGVLDWFHREPPGLGAIPLALLEDPRNYSTLINAATEPRSMPL